MCRVRSPKGLSKNLPHSVVPKGWPSNTMIGGIIEYQMGKKGKSGVKCMHFYIKKQIWYLFLTGCIF